MRSNFARFLLYGGILVAIPKLIRVIVPWMRDDPDVFGLGAFTWPVYFLAIFLKAIFAFNVHRFVLFGQRKFSFALNRTFWLFFTRRPGHPIDLFDSRRPSRELYVCGTDHWMASVSRSIATSAAHVVLLTAFEPDRW